MQNWNYPYTEKCSHVDVYHHESVTDEYAWLEKAKDVKVLDWVSKENACTDDFFAQFGNRLPMAMAALRNEKKKPEYGGYSDISVSSGILACKKTDGEGHESIVRISPEFEELETILDVDEIDPAAHLAGVSLNPADPAIAAIYILYPGQDRLSILVYNWKTKTSMARLNESFSYTWNKDGSVIYYGSVNIDKANRVNYNNIIAYHIYTQKSQLLYTYPDNSVLIQVALSDDGQTLFGEVWLNYHDVELIKINLDHTDSDDVQWVSLTEGRLNSYHYVGTIDGCHYILTDENAPRGRVIGIDLQAVSVKEGHEILPETESILMGVTSACGRLVVVRMKDVNEILEVYDREGRLLKTVEAPCAYGSYCVSSIERLGNVWNDRGCMFISYESFGIPKSVYRFDLNDYHMDLLYCTSDDAYPDLVVEQKFAVSADGTRVPAFLVYRKDTVFNGQVKTLMYGYGGYNAMEVPSYTCPYIGSVGQWVNEGNLYVLCTLRGGGEYGSWWHEQGYKDKKKNCFYDFIAITEMLHREGYTSPGKTAIIGGSNGGLLVTALLTMRPDLYQAVIASVPHTDMLHFKNDDRGPMYTTEYGDIGDEHMYRYIRSYSPYHNVKDGVKYPAVYIQTGECDNNVPPYHGKKMAARLQACGSELPVLLRVLPSGSHDTGVGEAHYLTIGERKIFLDWALNQPPKDL